MDSIQKYNAHIADLLLKTYYQMLDRENQIIRGGGSWSPQERLLPILGNQEPPMCVDPEGIKQQGGKLKIPKILKDVGHATGKIVAPIAKKGLEKVATKVVDKVADKAVNSLVNAISGNNADQAQENGAGIVKKRGRPRKTTGGAMEAKPKKATKSKNSEGGKLNFIKAISHIGSKVVNKVGNAVVNKGIDSAVKYLSNPAVDEGIATGAEMGAEAGAEGAGLKKKGKKPKQPKTEKAKRKPSRRNLILGQLMREHKMSMKEANDYIRKHGLK
jgi:ribosomal protein L12E/L44/L45/RPP1/RPP2